MNPYSPPGASGPYAPSTFAPAAAYGLPQPNAVSDLSVDLLRQTKPWVMLLSVLCFLASGFMIVAGVAMAGMSLVTSGAGFPGFGWLGLVYIPFAGLYVYPAVKMWSYSSAIGHLVVSRSPADLESALAQQKSFWKFCGIAAIITIVLYIVFFVGMMGYGFLMKR
jgi:hypothetical protein